ncbi:MAG: hypothetical protein JXA67_22195 [Micromonosporaceae bacterium]|nr:hypothetical protein [Micromonosporaceae bacterium]
MTTTRHRLRLPDPHPPVNVAADTDHDRGDVRYRVRGPRATGTVIISPEIRGIDQPLPTQIHIQFGDHAHRDHERADRLTINGVTLVGGVILTPDDYLTRDHVTLGLRRSTGPYTSTSAPTATNRYGSAIVRALVQTWYAHPDRDQLTRAAAGRTAAARLAELHRSRIQPTQERIEQLTRDLADHFRLADQLHHLARDYAQQHPAPDTGASRP